MTELEIPSVSSPLTTIEERRPPSTFARVVRYAIVRLLTLGVIIVVTVFLTILIVNLGGYLDTVVRANIDEAIGSMLLGGWLRDVTDDAQRMQIIDQTRAAMQEAAGLNDPFLLRCVRWLWRGLTLDWGQARVYNYFMVTSGHTVLDMVLEYLPRTLLVFGTANVMLFFTSIFLALGLSRKYGSWQDKLVTALAPLAAAPSWVYGLIISALLIHVFHISQITNFRWPPKFELQYWPIYLKFMLPAVIAIFLSKFFQSMYAWRTIFLINSSEDYVEIAKAKGMSARMLERRYILRPVLPNVITSFAMILVSLWQEVIILETVFNIAGIGMLFRYAAVNSDVRMITALVVTFGYLIAITVFLLDVTYAIVDPRVRIGSDGQAVRPMQRHKGGVFEWLRQRKTKTRWQKPVKRELLPAGLSAGMPVTPALSLAASELPAAIPSFLLKDAVVQSSESARRAMHATILGLGRRLAEAGALVSANDVFWLTREELKSAVDRLNSGQAAQPLNQAIRQRRLYRQAGAIALPSKPAASAEASRSAYPDSAAMGTRSSPRTWLTRLQGTLHGLSKYPGAVVGFTIILFLVAVSIYTIIAMPYKQATKDWRGDQLTWIRNPTYALPAWVNWFRKDKLPSSITLSSQDPAAEKTEEAMTGDTREISFSFRFDYPYTEFPQDIIIFFTSNYHQKKPLVTLTWLTPDGRSIDMGSFSITSSQSYYVFQDDRLERKLKATNVGLGLFGDPAYDQVANASEAPGTETHKALSGSYELQVKAYVFEEGVDMNADMVVYGKVWGPAGTDGQRRDVSLALLWGTPIALSFGLLAATGTIFTTLLIAAVGVWFGGRVDRFIQSLTEANMILPFFPVVLMVYVLYSKSFWVLLGTTVLLSVFGSSIKNFRSLFMQIKEMPYFEAARAYGASDWRIIFHYLIPRIGTIIIPQVVILVPSYVFLEAGLAVLGLFDPLTPPTWGQLVLDGLENGIQLGAYHMIFEPAVLLLLTGYAFLLLGSSLERVYEPRLRER
jgi:peptide/nickel transport system permease protein